MSAIFDLTAFRDVYARSVADVMRFVTPERQAVIATHNYTLNPDRFDLGHYLRASERRYVELVRLVNRHASYPRDELRALEVGGFLGAYALTLARLGLAVTLVEHYDFYQGAFDDLAAYLHSEGVAIWDADFTSTLDEPPERYTLVTNMAMLEHLPGSPKMLMDNLGAATDDHGLLVLEVPNIAYYPTRRQALKGRSIHPNLADVYRSAAPFTGHHREYTRQELIELLTWSGFAADELVLFNYSIDLRHRPLLERLHTVIFHLWPIYVFPSCRELIMAIARRGRHSDVDVHGPTYASTDVIGTRIARLS